MDKKICQMVTDRIISEMEKGIIPWNRPWSGTLEGAVSHSTGKPYSLLNQMLLGTPGEYITYNQAKAAGGQVRKGEKGKQVVFWKQVKMQEVQDDGTKKDKLIPMLRYYTVFEIGQCDGVKAKYKNANQPHLDPIQEAEDIVTAYQAREHLNIIRDQLSGEAFYAPTSDYIKVPMLEQYSSQDEYYSTLFHEMTHSTGHVNRLARCTGTAAAASFGSHEYGKEELIAEIGAASLVNHCGIETTGSLRNSAAYIQSWMKAIREDITLVIASAGKAEKAVNYILG